MPNKNCKSLKCQYCGCIFTKKYKESHKQFQEKKFCSRKCSTNNNIGKKSLVTENRISYWKSMCGKEGNSKKHGMSRTRFNGIYRKIRQRCITGCCPEAVHYRDRGIKCLWEYFESFRDDMHESYLEHSRIHGEKNTTIERIDNDGDYCKENCRWATMKEQCNNRGNNVIIKFGNVSLNLSEWSEKTGIKYTTIRQRIFNYGWSVERALTTTKH